VDKATSTREAQDQSERIIMTTTTTTLGDIAAATEETPLATTRRTRSMTSSSRRDEERRNFGPAFETPSRRNIDREGSPHTRDFGRTLGSDLDNESNIFKDPIGDRSFLSDEDENEIDKEIRQEELAKKRDYLESLRQE
jgi:hypothetical protein